MKARTGTGGLVYSTDSGRMCPQCRQSVAACRCATAQAVAVPGDGIVRVGRESKGRGGKTVTVIRGLSLPEPALAALAKRLKADCGSGGTVRDGVVEIQGDHADRLVVWLQRQGWVVKRTGG